MHDITQIDVGTLTASKSDRTVTGLLMPYGEECRSNLGKFKVGTGSFSIPADLSGMSLNVEHQRENVIGAPTAVRETPKGIVATFSIAKTPEGDKALDDIAAGRRKHLSAEVASVQIKNGRAVGGRLFAAALVEKPAFPSATLLAAADTEEPTVNETHTENEFVDEQGQTWRRVEDTTTTNEAVTNDDGSSTTTTTTTVVEEVAPVDGPPTDTPTEEEEEGGGTLTASTKAQGATPATLLAGAPTAPATTAPRPVELHSLFAALSRARMRAATTDDMTLLASASPTLAGSPEQIAATLMAALTDVKVSGTGSLPVGGAAIQPNWVGQIDQGITYERQYVPLAKTGTDITAEGKKGYKVKRGTADTPVDSYAETGNWSGNKSDIGTGNGFTTPHTSTLHRFAFGNDIAREYFDLPGGAETLAAYFALIKEDHLVWSDERARRAWITLGGAPVAESSAIPSDFPTSLGLVMQALRAIKREKADKRRDKPSFVIVNDEAAEELDFTPFEKIPEFIKFSWNLDGSGLADGDIVLVNGDMGITGTPAVLGGANYALELDELAGGPLWIDALDIAKGGIDRAVHGYLQEFQVRSEAVTIVGTPANRANSTAYPVGRLIKASSVVYRVVGEGTSDSSAPTAPAVGATVADGSATLLRLA